MSEELARRISACRLCSSRFANTATAHEPRPVPWFDPRARVLIAGQAPGARVHETGRPFSDASGVRLREWLGLDPDTFYDRSRIAIVPAAFCFPGYDAKGSDLPPPRLCGDTWFDEVMAALPDIRLTILVGGYSQRRHLGGAERVTDRVRSWRDYTPSVYVLPHPSWRNTSWLRKNPWFAEEVVPALRKSVRQALRPA